MYIVRLIGFVLMLEMATAISIIMSGGKPFDITWQSFSLLVVLLVIALVIIGTIFRLLTMDRIPARTALIYAVITGLVTTGLIIAAMGLGYDWLKTAAKPLSSWRTWWPAIVLVVSLVGWYLPQPTTRRSTTDATR